MLVNVGHVFHDGVFSTHVGHDILTLFWGGQGGTIIHQIDHPNLVKEGFKIS